MKIKILISFLMMIILLSPMGAIEAEEADENLVTALYFDSDIREALNDLMLQSGVNIIADDTVRGLVTIDLQDVPLEKALELILLGGGYSYRRFDDYYLVSMIDPRSPAFNHMAETENIKLNYISASEARDLIPAFYDPFVRSSDERGIITITATPEIISEFKQDLKSIDTRPAQIRVKAVVTEISSDLIKEYGANLFDVLMNTSGDNDGLTYNNNSLELTWYGKHERIMTNLKAFEQDEQLEIKADPQIVVRDRGTGRLFVGEEQVIVLEPENASARLERVEVGVSFQVKPRIMGSNEIELTLYPEISHFTEEFDKGLRIRKSEISTTVYARNGETIVMAGLTIDDQMSQERKVPILGEIPLIRWFFRQVEEKDAERELFIFITPEIISPEV
ncbi:MAG: secretin and TonB N-terminal domain-containing protein [Halanaerobiales bacterium]